jgi:hypothetical protein
MSTTTVSVNDKQANVSVPTVNAVNLDNLSKLVGSSVQFDRVIGTGNVKKEATKLHLKHLIIPRPVKVVEKMGGSICNGNRDVMSSVSASSAPKIHVESDIPSLFPAASEAEVDKASALETAHVPERDRASPGAGTLRADSLEELKAMCIWSNVGSFSVGCPCCRGNYLNCRCLWTVPAPRMCLCADKAKLAPYCTESVAHISSGVMNAYGFARRDLELPSSDVKLFVRIDPVQCSVLLKQISEMVHLSWVEEIFEAWWRKFIILDQDIADHRFGLHFLFDNAMQFSAFWWDRLITPEGRRVSQDCVTIDTNGRIRSLSSSHRPCHLERVFLHLTDSLLFASVEPSHFPGVAAFCEERLAVQGRHPSVGLQMELWFNTSIKELHFLAWFPDSRHKSVLVSIK